MRGCLAQATKSAIVFAALASWALPVLAQPPASERSAAALLALEHDWLSALQRRDVKRLARILAPEFIDSDFEGHAVTRTQYLAYFAHALARLRPPERQQFEDTRVRFIASGEVAIVTGVVLTRPALAGREIRHSRFTDVFVWRDARWQAVSGQETHFTPAAG